METLLLLIGKVASDGRKEVFLTNVNCFDVRQIIIGFTIVRAEIVCRFPKSPYLCIVKSENRLSLSNSSELDCIRLALSLHRQK